VSKKLLFSVSIKDCRVEALASTGGAGGQNKNRRHTAIRITHPPSGAVGFSADERDQLQNKRVAWRRMCESEIITGKSIEDKVEEAMEPQNLKIEVKKEGRWVAE
jgi:protein subunit release factor A